MKKKDGQQTRDGGWSDGLCRSAKRGTPTCGNKEVCRPFGRVIKRSASIVEGGDRRGVQRQVLWKDTSGAYIKRGIGSTEARA